MVVLKMFVKIHRKIFGTDSSATLLKIKLDWGCFLVDFTKHSRQTFLENNSG